MRSTRQDRTQIVTISLEQKRCDYLGKCDNCEWEQYRYLYWRSITSEPKKISWAIYQLFLYDGT